MASPPVFGRDVICRYCNRIHPQNEQCAASPPREDVRLYGQLQTVAAFMADGRWHTLAEISRATGIPEASVSAELRDLRKPKFGGHTIQRRRLGYTPEGRAINQYRLVTGKE